MKPVDSAADLSRLSEGAGSDLTSALRDLSARGPDAAELASLATRLSLQGIAMTPLSSGAAPRGAGLAPRAAWKWAAAGTAVLSGAGLLLLVRAPSGAGSPAVSRAHVGSLAAAPQSTFVADAKKESKRAQAPAPSPRAPAEPDSVASAEGSGTSSALPAPPDVAVHEVATPMREASSAPASPAPLTPSSPRQAPLLGKPAAAERSSGTAAEAPITDSSQPSELELLRGARLALKSSPSEALRQAEQHRASYPAGKLTQERELIAISALMALGRRTAALSRASRFEQSFPTSPYRKQIGELLQ